MIVATNLILNRNTVETYDKIENALFGEEK